MKTIYLDGQYLKVDDPIINTFTPGHFKTQGVFETMLGVDGFVMDMNLHLGRMRKGLKALGLKAPSLSPSVLQEILKISRLALARVRLMVWRDGREMHVMAAALPYQIQKDKKCRVCLVKTNRQADDRGANIKSLDYELFAEAFSKAQALGFDEALLLNRRGYIFEASRANIFWVKDKILYTPPLASGCLNGITRQQVIKQAKNWKMTVKEENLTPKIFKTADAAFLTNSLIGIKPIEMSI